MQTKFRQPEEDPWDECDQIWDESYAAYEEAMEEFDWDAVEEFATEYIEGWCAENEDWQEQDKALMDEWMAEFEGFDEDFEGGEDW